MSRKTEVVISIHPHKLFLSKEMKNICSWCLKEKNDATYNCKECHFSVHKSCANKIATRWRNHYWTSIEEDDDGCYNCCSCGGIVSASIDSPPSDVCRACNINIHKSCASNLESVIKSVCHRRHPLFLLPLCSRDDKYRGFVYCCNSCKFTLDMNTALQQPPLCLVEPENHKHQFIPLMRLEYSFPCDACGIKFERFGSSGPFQCTICQIFVHEDCTSLPHTINIFQHNHPLTHTFFFLLKEEDMPPFHKLNCRLCHTMLKYNFGGYYCTECHFGTHVGCADRNKISTNFPDQYAILDPFKEIKLTEDHEFSVEIKHFSHEHKLRLSDEIEDKFCDGCIRPISHPFYRCVECDFFLHKACIDLPSQAKIFSHEHILTLLPSAPNGNATFDCFICSKYCHGFVYSCEECNDFYVDVRCASIPLNFTHPGHDHRLYFTLTDTHTSWCDFCSGGDEYLFQCNECQFGIDHSCAALPSTARHWDHEHPLVLSYDTIDDGSDAYYCDICEQERNPNHWYYCCAQCDFVAHPHCALGLYPFLAPGRLFNISRHFFVIQGSDFEQRINLCSECRSLPLIPKKFSDHKLHKHPLVFNSHGNKVCDICEEKVEGIWFGCEECGFDAHFECVLGNDFNVPRRKMTLSIVKRTSLECLPCMVCDQDCRDACLKCPKDECSFLCSFRL